MEIRNNTIINRLRVSFNSLNQLTAKNSIVLLNSQTLKQQNTPKKAAIWQPFSQ